MSGLSVRCDELVHIYRAEDLEVVALRGVDLEVSGGETMALLGPSGSGKSTLLSVLGGLLRPSAGQLWLGEREVGRLGRRDLLDLRAHSIGIVLQGSVRNLLPYATPRQNIDFARRAARRSVRRDLLPAGDLLEALGLGAVADRPLHSLSAGEQQQVTMAAAVANAPGLLLADEPTSQLDAAEREGVLDLLLTVNRTFGTTVVVVTHDPAVGARLGRQVVMRQGRVGQDGRHGAAFAVVGKDGGLPLPDDLLASWPPGTLVEVARDGDELRLRRRDR